MIGTAPTSRTQLEVENPDGYNFALLGYGGKGHDGGYLTDVIILIHVDNKDKKVRISDTNWFILAPVEMFETRKVREILDKDPILFYVENLF